MTSDDAAEYIQLPIYRDQLARAMYFTPSDIEANRSGRLSDSQRSNQYRLIGRASVLAALFSVLTGLSVWGMFAIGITTGLGVALLLLGGAFAAFVGIFIRYNIPL
jgi:hypothetical protein